ncbi:MAG: photosystem II manganese-stabilizing polypeptide [Pseudanabaenaceae cyanobacterium SKYGB_i_bin29]|nr:photosystem II manganese-stabilizing polypeptide [Pseudanabaenaceae cyanobacterium SKYG29]MDW8421541.1 photosystem II manganese-stabilizing polypeptide [Pseudanabaenaceae cyanobacterium SKYGB_i_bin29]
MRFNWIWRLGMVFCLVLSLILGIAPAEAVQKPLTYDEILGTGLANKCPDVTEGARGRAVIPLEVGKPTEIYNLCLEPTNFFVKEEVSNKRRQPEFVPTKLLTRATSSLDFIKATVTLQPDGSLVLEEKEGLDYQPITVQLPGGERVAFLFSIKNYKAVSQPGLIGLTTAVDFEGETEVPTYRGASFIDPKGRGLAIGYDAAEALTAKRDEFEASIKKDEFMKGKLSMQIEKINSNTREIAGTFECEQPSDTEFGAFEPKEVKLRGIFYAKVR